MPFRYETRTQQFIDVTQAGPRDRIKVTFEDGNIVMLMLRPDNMVQRNAKFVNLCVDKQLTQDSVLEALYQHAVAEAQSHMPRRARKQMTLEAARTEVEIIVSVRRDDSSFDDSPIAGEYLKVRALFPRSSGSGAMFRSPVKTVEFITI